MNNFIGLKINELLSKKTLTKKQLAEKLGIARNTLDDYINGVTSIRVDDLLILAQAFQVPVDCFFENSGLSSNTTFQFGKGNINGKVSDSFNSSDPESKQLKIENEMLKARLMDKEEIISMLKEQVENLKKKE
jgi:transcriptional regulator with XRE-family HTH domain